MGEPQRALEHYQKAREISVELNQRAPDSAEFARDLVVSHYKIASLHEQQRNAREAEKSWKQCHEALLYMKNQGMYLDQPLAALLQQLEKRRQK